MKLTYLYIIKNLGWVTAKKQLFNNGLIKDIVITFFFVVLFIYFLYVFSILIFFSLLSGFKESLLTLTLLEPKVISLNTSVKPGQPAHPCSLTRLYAVGSPTSSSHLDSPKIIMDSSKNGCRTSPFNKFCRLRVNKGKY